MIALVLRMGKEPEVTTEWVAGEAEDRPTQAAEDRPTQATTRAVPVLVVKVFQETE